MRRIKAAPAEFFILNSTGDEYERQRRDQRRYRFVKEELNEHGKDAERKKKAQQGRDLRNEGRVEDGKAPKTTPPGSGHPEK